MTERRLTIPERCLMLVTEPCDALASTVAAALDGGVDAVQWRDKRVSLGGRRKVLAGLASLTRERALLLANGDWEANIRAGARHFHLPEKSAPIGVIRHRLGTSALVGKSVHSVLAARQAEQSGADYIVAGTIFESSSHPDVPAAGLEFLRDVCRTVTIPVLAIGGITAERVPQCVEAGAVGVAVLSAIMRADDPCAASRQFRSALDRTWEEKTCN